MPLSRNPEARRRQLANLVNAPAAPPGNQRRRDHGGYAQVALERLKGKAQVVYEALAADAPLRAPGGELPPADHAQVCLLAECLCRLEDVGANIRDFGLFERKGGGIRPAVDLERRLRQEAADYLDALGMTPRSRAKLGVDLARTVDLATAMSEPNPERRQELLEQAGLTVEAGDD
ncbi:MAG: P27 family phage terminase small subunit [Actinomycetota bacterium]|nr:P27 family phage terminase small subunit [Actinomycetota bacterium]